MSLEHCPAHGCGVPVGPDTFMCPDHWYLLSAEIRRKVVRFYRSGDGRNGLDQELLKDAQEAVEKKLFERCIQTHGAGCVCWKRSPARA